MDNLLIGYWYALGPADKDFSSFPEDFSVHRVVSDDAPTVGYVLVRNPGGQSFPVERQFILEHAFPPSAR